MFTPKKIVCSGVVDHVATDELTARCSRLADQAARHVVVDCSPVPPAPQRRPR